MDIKLIIKFFIVGITIPTIFFSCKSVNKHADLNNYYGIDITAAEKMRGENEADYWIRTYKQQVFYNCLYYGYKDKSIYEMLGKEDLGNPSDFIPFPFWPKMDEVGKNALRYMEKNDFISDDPEDKKKNFISKTCLNYLVSRELDSIAKNEYKKFKKMNYYNK